MVLAFSFSGTQVSPTVGYLSCSRTLAMIAALRGPMRSASATVKYHGRWQSSSVAGASHSVTSKLSATTILSTAVHKSSNPGPASTRIFSMVQMAYWRTWAKLYRFAMENNSRRYLISSVLISFGEGSESLDAAALRVARLRRYCSNFGLEVAVINICQTTHFQRTLRKSNRARFPSLLW